MTFHWLDLTTGRSRCGTDGFVAGTYRDVDCPECRSIHDQMQRESREEFERSRHAEPLVVQRPIYDLVESDGGLRRWWLRRRFRRAYIALRDVAEYHRRMNHDVEFIAINESRVSLTCFTCGPWTRPPLVIRTPGDGSKA